VNLKRLVRPLLAEAIGTFAFFVIGFFCLVGATVVGQGSSLVIVLIVPFGFGLGLFAAIWAFGHVSGGHFNPAVTLGALLDGRIDPIGAIGYVFAQVIGGVAAAFAVLAVIGQNAVPYTLTKPGMVGEGQAFAAEVIMTAIFVAVILTVTRRQPNLAAVAIGLTLVVIHFAAIPISGSSVNPARSLAPAIVSGQYESIWIYLSAPFLGAILGWLAYRIFNPPEEELDDEEELDLEDEEGLEEDLEAAG
jgi:aquaporin Z